MLYTSPKFIVQKHFHFNNFQKVLFVQTQNKKIDRLFYTEEVLLNSLIECKQRKLFENH